MKTKFTWRREFDHLAPVSESDSLTDNGLSLIDCLLMDDGGLRYADSLPCLNEGLQKVTSVATGLSESIEWNRETWGVEARNGMVKIYSLHDESCFHMVNLIVFSSLLQEWINFLQSQPDERQSRCFNFP